jgi:hypothetical protein
MTAGTTEPPPADERAEECAWCPVCRAAALLRTENPQALAKIMAATTAFVDALRDLITPAPATEPTTGTARGDAGPAPRPRVQRIVLETDEPG